MVGINERLLMATLVLIIIGLSYILALTLTSPVTPRTLTETVTRTSTITLTGVVETLTEIETVITTVTLTKYAGYPEMYSEYGGWLGLKTKATGFFRVENINGIYWLVDPLGYVFLSKGVNHVDYMGDFSPVLGYSPYYKNVLTKYGSVNKWVEVTVSRLLRWGFNTIGAWSSRELMQYIPYTVNLNILGDFGFDWQTGRMPDVFSDNYVEYAEMKALFNCKPLSNDPLLIGYFIDNEPRWGPDWRSNTHLLDDFIKLPGSSPGKKVVVDVLRVIYQEDIDLLNSEFKTSFNSFEELLDYNGTVPSTSRAYQARLEFLRRYVERYLSVAVAAIRKYDPNHLILGFRVAGLPTTDYMREVFRIAGKYVDVITVNIYNYIEPPVIALNELYHLTGKPLIVTEFSFRAMDSGLPNTRGAGIIVNTQSERANATYNFVVKLLSLPYVVGYHWFQYYDQPKEGRFDGENSNYGIVKIDDEPYIEMIDMFTKLNLELEKIHLNSR